MHIKEINAIGEDKFYAFSLDSTIEVIDELEKLNWSNIDDKNLEENSGFYSMLLDIVNDRVANSSFPEMTDDAERKSLLLLRVLRVKTSISQYRLLFLRNEVEGMMKETADQFETTKNNIKAISSETREEINKIGTDTKDGIKNFADDTQTAIQKKSADMTASINRHLQESEETFEKKIHAEMEGTKNRIEPQLIATVLTLMGVFSAIITIIMSVVVTSSSWLNNANGASAVIAFIVPNAVAVFSIIVLLLLVSSRKEMDVVVVSEKNWECPNLTNKVLKTARRKEMTTIAIIVIFTIGILIFSIFEIKSNDVPHIKYVLSQGMYNCKDLSHNVNEDPVTVIEFELDGKLYIIPYDKKYFHDGKLYFCVEHQMLE